MPMTDFNPDKAKAAGLKLPSKPAADYDAGQLAKGIEVEAEHTDDPEIAALIAGVHLDEMSDYYDRLERMESGVDAASRIGPVK